MVKISKYQLAIVKMCHFSKIRVQTCHLPKFFGAFSAENPLFLDFRDPPFGQGPHKRVVLSDSDRIWQKLWNQRYWGSSVVDNSCQYWVFEMGPLLGPSLGPISPFPLAALKLDEIDQNALLPNQKTVQSDKSILCIFFVELKKYF